MAAKKRQRAPIVLTAKSDSAARNVHATLGKLVDDGLLQPLTFDEARAFLDAAHDWEGPGLVVLMR